MANHVGGGPQRHATHAYMPLDHNRAHHTRTQMQFWSGIECQSCLRQTMPLFHSLSLFLCLSLGQWSEDGHFVCRYCHLGHTAAVAVATKFRFIVAAVQYTQCTQHIVWLANYRMRSALVNVYASQWDDDKLINTIIGDWKITCALFIFHFALYFWTGALRCSISCMVYNTHTHTHFI